METPFTMLSRNVGLSAYVMNLLSFEKVQAPITRKRQIIHEWGGIRVGQTLGRNQYRVIYSSTELSNEEELSNVPYRYHHTILVLIKQRGRERYLAP